MIYKTIVRCLFVLLSFIVRSYAQSIPFEHLTTEQGLDNNSVISICQDSIGFMWFGTISGLSRYDGSRFKTYIFRKDTSLPIVLDYPMSLYCDSKGILWSGTSNGLEKYSNKKDTFESVRIVQDKKQPAITSILEDKEHTLWIGTSIGLFVRRFGENRFLKISKIAAKSVKCLFQDSKGFVWVGTTHGLSRVEIREGIYHIINYYTKKNYNNSLASNYITAVGEDILNNIWIGTQNKGVSVYNPDKGTFFNIDHSNGLVQNNIRTIVSGNDGNLWIGTQEGISIIDPRNKRIKSLQHDNNNKASLSKNSVYSIFKDGQGVIWVGTYYGGLNFYYTKSTNFNVIQSNSFGSINNDIVSSIAQDANLNLWVGTEGGGLNYLDHNSGKATYFKNKPQDYESIGSNLVRCIYIDKQQNIWCGTHGGGLNVLPRNKKNFIRYLFQPSDPSTLSNEVLTILEDDQSRLWIGTSDGLQVFLKKNTDLTPLDIGILKGYHNDMRPNFLLKARNGKIWVGCEKGLYVIIEDKLRLINDKVSVNCLQEDSFGNIWLCLNYQGLAKYVPGSNSFVFYDEKSGFPAKSTYALLQDNNNFLWVSSDIGLIRFNPDNNIAQVYTKNDGLPGNEFNIKSFLKASDGEFFFGGFFGITHFFPDKIRNNKDIAPVVFTGLRLFNKVVDIHGDDDILVKNINTSPKITLKYNQNVVTIEFALLNFIKSNKNRFAYKLEGFDKRWNVTNNPYATYTNLSPGRYKLLVKGANNDGVWSPAASIELDVLPPLWRTWWAYVFYGVIVIAIFFLLLRYLFLKALLKKEDELHQSKLSFFTNISHEIRTHLALIIAPVERLIENNSGNRFMLQQLGGVKKNSDQLLMLVDELMDFRKTETNHLKLHLEEYDLIVFLEDIYTTFREVSLTRNISMSFSHHPDHILMYFSKVQLGKVFYNLLSNAFKFTPDGGKIIMTAEDIEGEVTIKVRDNGRGIGPEYLDKLFDNYFQVPDYNIQNTGYGIGLALSKGIVELHHGTIDVRSEQSESESFTEFTVTLFKSKLAGEALADSNVKPGFSEFGIKKIDTVQVQEEPTLLPNVHRETILIAEDNSELRKIIVQMLSTEYNIIESVNGQQCYEKAIENIPDLIVSDVMMPEMDGLSLCTKIKADRRVCHIPIILLTAKSAQNDQIEGLETGADLYITKPFNNKILNLSIRNLLVARENLWLKFSQQTPKVITSATLGLYKNKLDKEFLEKIIEIINDNMDVAEFGVERMSQMMTMSIPILYKKLKAVTGLTVNDFLKYQRLNRSKELLQEGLDSISEVAYRVGFNDPKYFSREFKRMFEKTPSEFLRDLRNLNK